MEKLSRKSRNITSAHSGAFGVVWKVGHLEPVTISRTRTTDGFVQGKNCTILTPLGAHRQASLTALHCTAHHTFFDFSVNEVFNRSICCIDIVRVKQKSREQVFLTWRAAWEVRLRSQRFHPTCVYVYLWMRCGVHFFDWLPIKLADVDFHGCKIKVSDWFWQPRSMDPSAIKATEQSHALLTATCIDPKQTWVKAWCGVQRARSGSESATFFCKSQAKSHKQYLEFNHDELCAHHT